MIEYCGFNTYADINGSEVESFLTDLRNGIDSKPGRAARTVNGYLESMKHFCRWLQEEYQAPRNPVAHLKLLNVQTDRRHIRRALTVDECQRLLAVTLAGPEHSGMTGADRALLYHIPLESGLRSGEIQTLTVGCCNLDGKHPTLTIKAAYNKAGREDIQPITLALAQALKEYTKGRKPDELLFGDLPPKYDVAAMLRKDLKAAGICYRNQEGKVVDFHALRHTYATNLARAGIHPKLAMALLRHSDINLTMAYYTHVNIKEMSASLDSLPNLDIGTSDEYNSKDKTLSGMV